MPKKSRNPFEEALPPQNEDNGLNGEPCDCPLERDIERLVIEGGKYAGRESLLSHLDNCFCCHEIFEMFREFYGTSLRAGLREGKLPGTPLSPPPDPLADYILHLFPRGPELGRGENPEDLYCHISSLVSHEGKITGEFLIARETGEILASFRNQGARLGNVICLIPILRKRFLTDPHGIVMVGRREPGIFMDAHVRLFLPFLRFTTNVGRDLTQEETVALTSIPGFPVESVLVYLEEESLYVQFSFGGQEYLPNLTALCVGRGKPEIAGVSDGIALFKKPHLGGPLEISVFPG
jgi:hypothetical protein